MADYTDHLLCGTIPYVTASELTCSGASDRSEDDPELLDAIDDASTVIYYLTGKQFYGTCEATVRPPCLSGHCMCGCSPNKVNLGLWPVTELISVRYNGVLYQNIPASEGVPAVTDASDMFHINDYAYLARNDGKPFLSGNQWAVAGGPYDTVNDGHTFEVTLRHGIQVPRLIKRATKALACNWLAACSGEACALPERVTSISRSGVSMDIASITDMLREGKTGIYEVDLAIAVFNPSKLQSPSFFWNPQGSGHGTRVGT